jgi:progressive ankylosis protein
MVFRFWLPLAATWLMMSAEGPLIAAIIARLKQPTLNLAAYGVAFSLALIVEAPIIMIMSASIALVKDRESLRKLRLFTFVLNGGLTLIIVAVVQPGFFTGIASGLLGLPEEILEQIRRALIILIPWPGAIGYRRFYQGILIRHGLTRRVAYGTVIRLTSMACTALILARLDILPGASVGASALSAGVVAEAAASRLMAGRVLALLKATEPPHGLPPMGYLDISRFYYPLALTSLIMLGVHPMVTFFVGQSRHAVESLAVLPVVNSLVFIFRSMGISYQEVGIALMGSRGEGWPGIKKFGGLLALCAAGALGFVSFTPAANLWFCVVSGLTPDLALFALTPTRILALMPALAVFLSIQRAVLVNAGATGPITWATAAEFAGVVASLLICIHWLDMIGATAAAVAFIAGRLAAHASLVKPFMGIIAAYRHTASPLTPSN